MRVCKLQAKDSRINSINIFMYVLRYNPFVIQDISTGKEYLTVKLKQLEGMSFTDYHR